MVRPVRRGDGRRVFDVPLDRKFARLGGMRRISDRVSLLRFRHLLEKEAFLNFEWVKRHEN